VGSKNVRNMVLEDELWDWVKAEGLLQGASAGQVVREILREERRRRHAIPRAALVARDIPR